MGYEYNDSTSRPNQISSFQSSVADHNIDHLNNYGDEEDENGEEDTDEYEPYAVGGDQGSSRVNKRFRQRSRKPRSELDKQQLLAFKDKVGMKWTDIFKRFPDRTPGAIRTRWHMLHGKEFPHSDYVTIYMAYCLFSSG